MKKIWKEYFSFSKKERIGGCILLFLIAGFMIIPYLIPEAGEPPVIDPLLQAFVQQNKKIYQEKDSTESPETYSADSDRKAEIKASVFPFDPNLITMEEWMRLGLSSKTAGTIIHYRIKGGKFKRPEDIRKIWGLSGKDADRLIPYVRIKDKTEFAGGRSIYQNIDSTNPYYGKNKPSVIDINSSDPENWKTLPGIGEVLANRIVHYRERIGGFSRPEQVKKVFGIRDSVYQLFLPYLKINPATLPKLDLNRASPFELVERTGVSADVAKAIVVYRQQYGAYQKIADLKKIVFMTDSVFNKIIPNVTISTDHE